MSLRINPSQVAEARKRSLLWEIRLEFVGWNAGNVSGHSEKFWSIEAINGTDREVLVRWGKIGSDGQCQRKPYNEALDKLTSKLSDGYKAVTPVKDLGGSPAPKVQPPVQPEVALPEPYCRISTIVLGKGDTFVALDKDNLLVLNLSRTGVLKLFGLSPKLRDSSPSVIL